ncbi:Gfo/Idh/MocA family protein, partial [Sphingomonas bacterium]|uniref:Gfo/Idh/MocA family protein n=1 Tax=Sphingomonas bacterium TaxID=1895847 RepID=UPI001C2CDB24
AVAAAAGERQRDLYTASRMIEETAALYEQAVGEAPARTGDHVTRIGFIGAGGIAHRHFGVLERFEDVAIVAVCDVDEARARDAAARFGARAFTDPQAMLAATELDALYICVPPFAHGAPERAAIGAGLPFFVEKPVALDLATAEAIAAEVAAAGLVTAVGYHWRYLDTVDEVRALLAHNPAKLMSGYWLDSTPPPVWWWHADQSGGQMVEQTTHLLDLARYLGGAVTRVYGLAGHIERPEFPGLDVPTVSTASLQFASGAIANFASTCLLGWNHRVGLHLFGDRLAVEITDHDLMVDVGRGRPVRGAEGDPVWREDRDFVDAVQGKANAIRCPYAEAVATHRLALAIGESARTGQAIVLEGADV